MFLRRLVDLLPTHALRSYLPPFPFKRSQRGDLKGRFTARQRRRDEFECRLSAPRSRRYDF